MRLTVHRGTHQIGGSCVELAASGGRLVLDLGRPLIEPGAPSSGAESEGAAALPSISGLYADAQPEVTALILSHAHLDHYGLANYVHPEIPIYASEGTAALLDISRIFIPRSSTSRRPLLLPKEEPVPIGPFTVTGYLVDHSAPDALALLVEAERQRVFYSGDLRAHGRKAALFERLVRRPPADVDCLLLEGTMLGRGGPQAFPDERAVEEALIEVFRQKSNVAMVFCSSQNLDRLVSIYRAAKQSQALLVIDLYTAYLLRRLRVLSSKIPQFDWPLVRVMYWKRHADRLADAGEQGFLYAAARSRIRLAQIGRRCSQVVMLAKSNSLLPIIARGLPTVDGIRVIWSMWHGYLTGEDIVSRFCSKHGLKLQHVHTSGHATVSDLQRLAQAVRPRQLVPIHTAEPERYTELFSNVHLASDGVPIHV